MNITKIIVLAAVTLLSACVGVEQNSGYVKAQAIADKVVVGTTSKEDVLRLLGTPSTTSNFGTEKWYYVSKRTETKGVLTPKVKEHQVVEIEFDESGVAKNVGKYSEQDLKKLEVAEEKTPTSGQKLSLIQQLIGNIGRFNRQPAEE